jgi:hypothetical protein
MRKLLVILNAMLRDRTSWNPATPPQRTSRQSQTPFPPFPTQDTTFFRADECWCAGEVLTTDGAYTKHKPIFSLLPGAS